MILFNLKTRLIKLLTGWLVSLDAQITVEPYMFFKKMKVKVSDIEDYENMVRSKCSNFHGYRWEKLKSSITNDGLHRPLAIIYGTEYKKQGPVRLFTLSDGNHRLSIIRELYGDDYMVDANLYLPDPYDPYNKNGITKGKIIFINSYNGREERQWQFKAIWEFNKKKKFKK